jgi:hypothetical protein
MQLDARELKLDGLRVDTLNKKYLQELIDLWDCNNISKAHRDADFVLFSILGDLGLAEIKEAYRKVKKRY